MLFLDHRWRNSILSTHPGSGFSPRLWTSGNGRRRLGIQEALLLLACPAGKGIDCEAWLGPVNASVRLSERKESDIDGDVARCFMSKKRIPKPSKVFLKKNCILDRIFPEAKSKRRRKLLWILDWSCCPRGCPPRSPSLYKPISTVLITPGGSIHPFLSAGVRATFWVAPKRPSERAIYFAKFVATGSSSLSSTCFLPGFATSVLRCTLTVVASND